MTYIEDLQISARGKKGAIAKAIYNMPDNLEIFSKAISIVSEISDRSINLILVNPWNTSKSHNNCGGILDRTLSNYDYAPCKKCNSKVHTHINAAKNIAQKGREFIKNYNSPSSHVRGSGEIPQEISSD
ncbi:MAG: zinc ribbon domain-containing protein [Candidatus Heimdallarchaeaceae archaeon]